MIDTFLSLLVAIKVEGGRESHLLTVQSICAITVFKTPSVTRDGCDPCTLPFVSANPFQINDSYSEKHICYFQSQSIRKAAAFKSQAHTNNSKQLAEQKASVLASLFSAVTYLAFG